MRILHICLAAFYIENYSYQENLLPKYHKKLGHDVHILASTKNFDENGKIYYTDKEEAYVNSHGIPVKRILNKKNNIFYKKINYYKNIYEELDYVRPDLIFIHGVQFFNISDIIKYKNKNRNTIIIIDNHADFSNSGRNWFSKNILHKFLWRKKAKQIEPYARQFFGVLPARVNFLTDIYKISKNKTDLLIMGGDDDLIYQVKNDTPKKNKIYHFNMITGGKIDSSKKEVLSLMKLANELEIPLKIFGTVSTELIDEFNELATSSFVTFVGWKNSKEIYELVEESSVAIFPGRHSVLWEEVAAIGKPLIVKEWPGTKHVNINGNCVFLRDGSEEEIRSVLSKLKNDNGYVRNLSIKAESASKNFYYSEIAKKSLSCVDNNYLKQKE